jgi:hypothetical protein
MDVTCLKHLETFTLGGCAKRNYALALLHCCLLIFGEKKVHRIMVGNASNEFL